MKHLRLTLTITIILAALAFNSCSKGIPVIFNDLTMGFVSGDNEITTDAGLTYFLTSAPADFNAEFGSRIYASFEVEDCIDENSGKFYARLTSFQIPLTIVPTDISKGSTPEFDMDSWKDAVNVNSAWISGGYLNILATWLAHKNSGIEHKTVLDLAQERRAVHSPADGKLFRHLFIGRSSIGRAFDESYDFAFHDLVSLS